MSIHFSTTELSEKAHWTAEDLKSMGTLRKVWLMFMKLLVDKLEGSDFIDMKKTLEMQYGL